VILQNLLVGVSDVPNTGVLEWDSSKVYLAEDVVTYNGKTYTAGWWTQGDTPGFGMWGV